VTPAHPIDLHDEAHSMLRWIREGPMATGGTEAIDHQDALRGISVHDTPLVERLLQLQVDNIQASGLDPRAHSLVRLAALVTLDAAPASFVWTVGIALESGVTPDEIVGVLIALAPTIGTAKVVAAAPEIALALGVDIPLALDGEEEPA
jgi:4-carboxymuconolactone decarboxylase